jgi:hypothetical protein
MPLRVVGAGLGRTGTHSLKLALERLLGAPCYHMMEVFERPDDIPVWQRAAAGEMPDWERFLDGYAAAVDWPEAAFWRELSDAYPDAPVLLSTRDVDGWWRSASSTIFSAELREHPPGDFPSDWPWDMIAARFTPRFAEEAPAKAAYLEHNDAVRRAIPSSRLVEWHPGDGWEPICTALALPVPAEPFPHVNSTAEFRVMTGIEPARSDA